jgi:hypothetical protein
MEKFSFSKKFIDIFCAECVQVRVHQNLGVFSFFSHFSSIFLHLEILGRGRVSGGGKGGKLKERMLAC